MNTQTNNLPTGVHFFEFDWPIKVMLNFPRTFAFLGRLGKIRLALTVVWMFPTIILCFFDASRTLVFGFLWVLAPLFTLTLIMRTKTISRKSIFAIFTISAGASPFIGFISEKVNQLGITNRTSGSIVQWQIANPGIIAPVMEEVFKIWPLLILPLFFSKRIARFTCADWLIVTFASGAGFMAFEEAMRAAYFWEVRNNPFVKALGVEGLDRNIFPWAGSFNTGFIQIASHAVLAGLIGATYGITRRLKKCQWLPIIFICWAIVDHSAFNGNTSKVDFLFREIIESIYSILGSGKLYVFVFILAIIVIHFIDIMTIGNPLRQDIGILRAYSVSFSAGRIAHKSRSLARQVKIQSKPSNSKKLYLYILPIVIFWIGWMLWVAIEGNLDTITNSNSSCLFCIFEAIGEWWENAPALVKFLIPLAIGFGLVAFGGIGLTGAMTAAGIIEFGLESAALAQKKDKTSSDYFEVALSGAFAVVPILPKGLVSNIYKNTLGKFGKNITSKIFRGSSKLSETQLAKNVSEQLSDTKVGAKDTINKLENKFDDFMDKNEVLDEIDDKLENISSNIKVTADNMSKTVKANFNGVTKFDATEVTMSHTLETATQTTASNGVTILSEDVFTQERFEDTVKWLEEQFGIEFDSTTDTTPPTSTTNSAPISPDVPTAQDPWLTSEPVEPNSQDPWLTSDPTDPQGN